MNYEVNVMAYNATQEADFYVFSRIQKDYSRGWLVGWIKTEDFKQQAMFRDKGFVRDDGFVYDTASYVMLINELNQF